MTKKDALKYVPLVKWLNSVTIEKVDVFAHRREWGVRATKNGTVYGFTICADPPDGLFLHEKSEYRSLSLGVALYTLATGKTIV